MTALIKGSNVMSAVDMESLDAALADFNLDDLGAGDVVIDDVLEELEAIAADEEEEIEEVAWEELMPECLWKFRVKDFGPLTVGIDSHGNSLFHDVQERAKAKLEELYERL